MGRAAGEGGDRVDPRFSLANERTLLAWIRTALALLAGGIGAVTLLPPLGVRGGRAVLGAVLTGLGLLVAATAERRWARAERALRRGEPVPVPIVPRIVALGVALVCAGVVVLVVGGWLPSTPDR